jgi:hypothetical protein
MRDAAIRLFGNRMPVLQQVSLKRLGWRHSGPAFPRDLQKAEGDRFADSRANGLPIDAELLELIVGDWKAPVLLGLPTVMRELDLKSIQQTPRGQAQDAIRRRLQHLDGPAMTISPWAYRVGAAYGDAADGLASKSR